MSQSRVEGGIHTTREVVSGGLLGAALTLAIYLLVFWHVPGRML